MKKNHEKYSGDSAGSIPLAIVGLGCLFPKANDPQAFWANIKNGVDAITEVPPSHWSPEDYFNPDPKSPDRVYAKHGGFLSPVDFNPMEYGVLPNALEAIDTSQLLGLLIVDQALKDAGYGAERDFDREKVSVILGVTGTLELVIPLASRLGHPQWRQALKDAGVEEGVAADVMARISDAYVPWQENSFPGLLGNVVAGRISKHFNFGGTNCVCDAACGSSLSALNLAALELATGKADMVVTGGIDTFNDIFMYTCFSKTPALSPSGHARPFDADGDGTTLGEGLGILVLKRLADAERDGDRIYAVLKGLGSSSDGRGSAIYEPSAAGQTKALKRAYEQGDVDPATIELIEAHGTGTRVGDAVEVNALREVFGEGETPWCALGSVKSQIGHTKAASGAAGLIKAALSLYHKTLPPTIKVKKPQEAVTSGKTPFYVNAEARPWIPRGNHPRRAGVSALGFGGANFHCLLEEYSPVKPGSDWKGDVQLVPFSAADRAALKAALQAFPAQGTWNEVRLAAARCRSAFDPALSCRLSLVLEEGLGDPAVQIRNALTLLEKNSGNEGWSAPDGTVFFAGDAAGRLGILFPGQGAQYPGMLKDLAIQFPTFLETLREADEAFAVSGGPARLSERIYPHPAFDAATRMADDNALRATEIAQPALGAVSLGAQRVLSAFGVAAEAFAGHSYGELTALAAAGSFDSASFHALSRLRGELMAAGEGDRGSMLAVSAPLGEIEAFLSETALNLVLANRNTPGQGVLSGPSSEIARAAALLAERGVRCTQLSVSAAFHSPLVAEASGPFAARLQAIPFQKTAAAVYSNTSGHPYPATAKKARDLLAAQLASPVDFVAEIENMYQSGIRTFLEVGPGARLTGMVKAILGERPHQAIALDASGGKRSGINDLARVLGELSVLGTPLDLSLWDEGYAAACASAPAKKKGMTVPLCGANYFKAPPRRPAVAPKVLLAAPSATLVSPAVPSAPAAPPRPAAATPPAALQEALSLTQQSLQALQSLQEQTARLHQQFLEGQESATRTFLTLVEQQRQLFSGAPVQAAPFRAPAVDPVEPPAPVAVAPQVVSAPAVPVAAVPSAPAVDGGRVAAVLLSVIAEKTGYPAEMLELEMSLDADLGIDSIKRVEILSALQERLPDAPAVRPEDLGTLQTLGQIVAHLGAGMAPGAPAPVAPAVDSGRVAEVLLSVIAEKTGYPAEMLELEMSLDADLGIDSIKRVEILSALQERLPGAPAVRPEDLGTLQTLGQIVAHLGAGMAPGAPAPAAPAVDSGRVAEVLLSVIAEKTGYPAEMLELEMSLDADLGIDSIKRVEILSALQERLPGAPAVRPEDLGTLQTLGQIVAHLGAGMAPAAPVVPAAPSLPSAAPAVDGGRVAEVLLSVIAEKTGYPAEMLELEMSLDADLGIDSIKRVEILSALQERLPGAPAVRPEDLGTLQTLGQIVDHLTAAPRPAATTPSPRGELLDRERVSATLLGVIAEKTGYPVEMLELEMALDTDLGIDSIKRVEILSTLQERLPGAPAIRPEHLGTLQTVGQIVDFLASVSGVPSAAAISAPSPALGEAGFGIERRVLKVVPLKPKAGRAAVPLAPGARIWVSEDGSQLCRRLCERLSALHFHPEAIDLRTLETLTPPARLGGVILLAPSGGTDDRFLADAFGLVQLCGPALVASAAEGGAFLATVSRLNGSFGLAPGGPSVDPLSGGLAGLAKTAGHEWPQVACKAIDLAADLADPSAMLAEEILAVGPEEVGISAQGLHTLKLTDLSLPGVSSPLPLSRGDVVVISGGARGVTAEIAVALAASSQATLLLLGRSAPPSPEPAWLAGLSAEAEIKKALIGSAAAPLKPKDVEAQYQTVLGNREIRSTLSRIAGAGGCPLYRSVDLRDAEAVGAVIAEVRSEYGPIRGMIHGAGVLADRLIADKTAEQFDSVYSTKVGGLRSLLGALDDDELSFMVMFSSSTGRFGRTGQIDYAVANEVLNKIAQQQALLRPSCRVLSLNWGPWDGGMVTPALKKVFAEEGIAVIDLRAGAEYLLEEISTPPGGPVELVILGGQGESAGSAQSAVHQNIYVSKAFDLDLSIEQFPFLRSHVMDQRAVLPMAMIIEWMAHGAIHNNPGLRFHGFNDLRVLKGVTLEPGASHVLQVMTGKAIKSGGFHMVPVELSGTDVKGQQFVHCRARMVLAARLPEGKSPAEKLELPPYAHPMAEVYRPERLFHGPDFQGIREMVGCSAEGIGSLVRPAPLPSRWINQPLRNAWLADPLALDCSFQMMILWSFERYRAGSLPVFAGRYRQYCESFPESGAEIRIRILSQSACKAVAEIEFVDPTSGILLARMEDYECVIDASLNASFARNKLQGAA